MNRALTLVVLVVMTMTACSDGQPPAGQSILNRGTGEEPESLDVHKSSSTEAGHVQRDLGEGLVSFAPDGTLAPAAAEGWTLSVDGTVYTFMLRPAARWSNGEPVTAEDFVYSYRRLLDSRDRGDLYRFDDRRRQRERDRCGDDAADVPRCRGGQ